MKSLLGRLLRAPSVEIRVPISPTPNFFNRVRYLAASLRVHGGPLADSKIVVSVGADEEPRDLARELPWSSRYPIEWSWVPREVFRERSYFATRLDRLRAPTDASHVLLMDPDTFVAGRFDDLLRMSAKSGRVMGITAHVTPLRNGRTWEETFRMGDLPMPELSCVHSGYGMMFKDESRSRCPGYLNLGIVLLPAQHARTIGEHIYEELDRVESFEPFFRAQTSLMFALYRNNIPWELMPMRYHFANDSRFLPRFAGELADVRMFHYLRDKIVSRERDFESVESVGALLERTDLDEANAAMIEKLRPVHAHVCAG
ncbi:MAG: hypothetical protein AAF995_08175 [Planctomycetota bacterium]